MNNNNYIPPFSLFIILTTKCNLNCYGCDMFCSIDQPNIFYIDINQLQQNLLILKKQQISLKNIILTGGEPLLHQDLIKICKLIRDIFLDLPIEIFTNGLLINRFNNQELQDLNQLQIGFSISLYPDPKFYNQIIKNIDFLKNNKCQINELEKSRPIFNKTTYQKLNIDYQNDLKIQQEKFKNCDNARDLYHHNNIFLYDNKIINCSTIIGFLNCGIAELPKHDYLLITDQISNEQIATLKQQPNFLCSHCEGGDKILWHKQADLNINNKLNIKDIFLYYYDTYKILQDDPYIFQILKNDAQFALSKKTLDDTSQWDILKTRFFGKKDICFIFKKTDTITPASIQLFKNYLLNQAKDTNFYLLCINLSTQQEEILYNFLKNMYQAQNNLNTYFIKNINLNQGVLYFLEHSYGATTLFKEYGKLYK